MNTSNEQLIETFNEAKARAAGPERERFLAEACRDDPVLKEQILSLLQAHEGAGDFLKHTPAAPTAKGTEQPGDRIGHYRLLQQIGEGGCGVVYMAEQEEPVHRRVALKVIKLGMDTKAVVARFEAERQALALMDHPNIAKVLEAGATETGRPYFVMELVRGVKITDYCDQAHLSTDERLRLFMRVCHAIQHAHQKGIIHRDIKPSNVIVTIHDGVAVPKVIDFGIAKATTDQRLTDMTVFTAFEQFVGTPAYMSPEQAEMGSLDIDTRSDIYSLGVLLYELLTRRTPFDSKQLVAAGLDAMRRTIREKEPPRPSTRLTQELVAVESSRPSEAGDLAIPTAEEVSAETRRQLRLKEQIRRVRGDLDWIVMKCLEKDRSRRYETANSLAADLKRHLDHEPVIARPPSRWYEFQKTVRRHRLGFAATAAVLVVLAAGVAVSAWQTRRATRARAEAVANERKAQRAQALEREQRQAAENAHQQAQALELAARRRAYASDINLAQQAINANNAGHAERLLNRLRPRSGESDLRGWEWRYLWQLRRSQEIDTLCQKQSGIDALTVSSDGHWLAVGERYGSLSIWDLRSKKEVIQLPRGTRAPRAVFAPNDPVLAFDSFDDASGLTVRLWDAASGNELRRIPQPAGRMIGLAFSSDGARLLTQTAAGWGATNSLLSVFRVADGSLVVRHSVPGVASFTEASGLAVTPDLKTAFYGTFDGWFHAVDLDSGRQQWRVRATEESVMAVALAPDGKLLATGGGFADSSIKLWDARSGAARGSLEGHFSFVGHLLFLSGGTTLVSASGDQTIRLWDIETRQAAGVLNGHRLEVWRLASAPDGRTILSGCKDGSVKRWDPATVDQPRDHWVVPMRVNSWCFAPDGRGTYVVESEHPQRRRVHWIGAPDFREAAPVAALGSQNREIAISPNGRWLAAVQRSGTITLFDRTAGRVVTNLVSTAANTVAAFCADGRWVAGLDDWGNGMAWDLDTLAVAGHWKSSLPDRSAHALAPHGRSGLNVTMDGELAAFDCATGTETRSRLSHREVRGVVISPNDRWFATCSGEGTARLWEVGTFQELGTFHGLLLAAHSIAFSPDGQRLAAGSGGREAIKLWDVESFQELLTLPGRGSIMERISFSADGTLLGVVNRAGQLYVWRAPSWAEIHAAEAKEKAESRQP